MEVYFHLKKKIKEKEIFELTLVAVRWRCTFEKMTLCTIFLKRIIIWANCDITIFLGMWLKVAIIVLPFVFQTHVVSFWHTFFIEDNHLNAWKCLTLCMLVFQPASVFMWEVQNTFLYLDHLQIQITPFLVPQTLTYEGFEAGVPNWVLNEQLPKRIVMSRLVLGSILFNVWFYSRFMLHIPESVNLGSIR